MRQLADLQWHDGTERMADWTRRVELMARNRAEGARLMALRAGSRLLFPGYRPRFPQLDWLADPDFTAYLERFGEGHGLNAGRRFMVHQLLRLTSDVLGDTAECGVFQGAGSWLILAANARDASRERTHFMFDSFEGLSAPAAADGSYWRAGDMAVGEEIVARNLSAIAPASAYRLMRGWIPERFAEVADRRFAFVHVDVDLYEPTRDSLAFFLPRLSPGGLLVVDDYGFATCPGATRAVEEVLAGHDERMIALPDGGGFLVKGTKTAAAAPLAAR